MGRSAPASMIIAFSYPMIRTLILSIPGTGLDRDATRPVTARHAFASSDVSCLRCFSCRCVVYAKAKLSEQMTPTPLLTRREQVVVQTLIAETSIIVEKRLTRQGLRGPWMHCRCCRCCEACSPKEVPRGLNFFYNWSVQDRNPPARSPDLRESALQPQAIKPSRALG